MRTYLLLPTVEYLGTGHIEDPNALRLEIQNIEYALQRMFSLPENREAVKTILETNRLGKNKVTATVFALQSLAGILPGVANLESYQQMMSELRAINQLSVAQGYGQGYVALNRAQKKEFATKLDGAALASLNVIAQNPKNADSSAPSPN